MRLLASIFTAVFLCSFACSAASAARDDASGAEELPSDPSANVGAAPHQPLKTYKVWIWQESGDCLWRIAQKVYGDRSKWTLIYAANRDVIKDPNKIYPKQRLKIPPPDWQP